MTRSARSGSGGGGVVFVLGATVVAGVVGYVVQLLAPATLADPSDYVAFSVFWSALYLMVGTVGGLQQEVARATHPVEGDGSASALRRLTAGAIGVAGAAAVAVGLLIGPASFSGDVVVLALWLGVGVAGYLLVAVLSGVLYGLRIWSAIAAVTIVDAIVRGVLVSMGLLWGAPPAVLGAAVALPFGFAFLSVWLVVRRRVVGRFSLDVTTGRLVAHGASTMVAAAATGVVVTGLPLVLGVTMSGQDTREVATLISVVTITRAPLIIPLFALQSFLVVDFRGRASILRPLLRFGALIALATAAGMTFAYFAGPEIISWISSGRFVIEAWPVALVVLSAGVVALLSLTGSALLARSRHAPYALGWVVAAVATIGLLALPGEPAARTITALLAAPALGLVVHLTSLGRMPRAASSAAERAPGVE